MFWHFNSDINKTYQYLCFRFTEKWVQECSIHKIMLCCYVVSEYWFCLFSPHISFVVFIGFPRQWWFKKQKCSEHNNQKVKLIRKLRVHMWLNSVLQYTVQLINYHKLFVRPGFVLFGGDLKKCCHSCKIVKHRQPAVCQRLTNDSWNDCISLVEACQQLTSDSSNDCISLVGAFQQHYFATSCGLIQ